MIAQKSKKYHDSRSVLPASKGSATENTSCVTIGIGSKAMEDNPSAPYYTEKLPSSSNANTTSFKVAENS
jgi:hypothetical protein